MEPEKKPKKRGRKPKHIKKEDSKKGEKKKIKENLIIQLKKTMVDDYNIQSFDTVGEKNECYNEDNKSKLCWNCCHKFNKQIYGIPMKYIHEVFYIYGDFCSLECACRYAHDNLQDYDFVEIFSLINLYSNIICDKKERIEMAPNRLLLNVFGGPLTIEEYRSKNVDNYEIRIPPILPIKHLINKYELNKLSNKSVLKLYRKTPIQSEKKSITSSMKLILNSQE